MVGHDGNPPPLLARPKPPAYIWHTSKVMMMKGISGYY